MSKAKKAVVASLEYLISDLLKALLFVLSHPLYLSYFIFFSPYLIKLFSFLSPLFVTTALLLLAFLTTVNGATFLAAAESPSHSAGGEEEPKRFEDLEVYKIVFDDSSGLLFQSLGSEDDNNNSVVPEELVKEMITTRPDEDSKNEEKVVDKSVVIIGGDSTTQDLQAKKATVLGVETLKWCLEEEKKADNNMFPIRSKSKAVKEDENEDEETRLGSLEWEKVADNMFPIRSKSKAVKEDENEDEESRLGSLEWEKVADNMFPIRSKSKAVKEGEESPEWDYSSSKSSSVRRQEKEWRRTLACKLFEERHNAAGPEGMDLLWETYEKNEAKDNRQSHNNKNSKVRKKGGTREDREEEEEDEDEDEEEYGQALCCLQALKFSAGKVNLGMARPNLVKISKAFKGIGWLHNVTRHAKKRYSV